MYNKEHNISPQSIQKELPKSILEILAESHDKREKDLKDLSPSKEALYDYKYKYKDIRELQREIKKLKRQMQKASSQLDFEQAARIRDQILQLQMIELE